MSKYWLVCSMVILGWIPLSGAAPDPILVDYFYEPGCSECEKIQSFILPAMESEFSGRYVLIRHDMGVETNVLFLLSLEKGLGVTNNSMNCIYLDRHHPFYGFADIKANLLGKMRELVAMRFQDSKVKPVAAEK
jgi:hypothetical protein